MSEEANNRFRIIPLREAHVVEIFLPLNIEALEFDTINDQLGTHIASKSGAFWIVDLAHAEYIGSALLGMLINLRSKVRSSRGKLILCQITPPLGRVIQASSMERLFTIVASREEALSSF